MGCFSDLGYDINEPINNVTPIQHYCNLSKHHYIMPLIIESFIKIGKAKINHFIGGKQTITMSQLIANSDAKVGYDKLNSLKMMIDKFNLKLDSPKKRKQDICYVFIERYTDQKSSLSPYEIYLESTGRSYRKAPKTYVFN